MNLQLSFGDDKIKIILNTKGTMADVIPELKSLLDYMKLQMNYREKYEHGIEQGNKQSAIRMIKARKLSSEEISTYTGLTIKQIVELEKELQCNSLQSL